VKLFDESYERGRKIGQTELRMEQVRLMFPRD